MLLFFVFVRIFCWLNLFYILGVLLYDANLFIFNNNYEISELTKMLSSDPQLCSVNMLE